MTDAPTEREEEGAWAKLRRRKVVQWGLAYAAGAWALLQGIGFLADAFHWPDATKQVGAIGLAVGLPVVLVVAWYHGDRGQQRVSGVELAILSVLLALGGGALWLYGERDTQVAPTSAPPAAPTAAQGSSAAPEDDRPSIAVLPFENRSRVDGDVFFVDGIHDDILTQLSKVSALKVISRTSVEKFRDTKLSTKEIAGQLGVGSILEGGVQRAGDRVRINVQLIDAGTDAHLWAETYDRELTAENIFAIQSEVAQAITTALRATLTADERARLTAVPTFNLEAWENYQLGQQRLGRRTAAGLTEAAQFYRKAIELDPRFALAYSGLAYSLALSTNYADVPLATTLDEAQAAADLALQLDPGLADAWASAAYIAYARDDFERAEELHRRAIELNPNHAMALKFYANLLSTQGRTDESVRYLERAARLDPLSAIIQHNLGEELAAQGKFEDAAGRYRRAIEIDPAMPGAYLGLAGLARDSLNDYSAALRLAEKAVALDPDNPYGAMAVWAAYWDLGDDASFDRVLQQSKERWPDNALVNVWLGLRDLQRGDRNGAERHARRTLEANPRDEGALLLLAIIDYRQGRYAESLTRYRKTHPDLLVVAPRIDASNHWTALAIVPALLKLGKGTEALALLDAVQRVLETLPLLRRAPDDARALALRGRKQEALAVLRAAQRAGWRWLWRFYRDVDPAFDSIRNEPEFKAIFADIERDMARQRAELAARPKDAPLDLDPSR